MNAILFEEKQQFRQWWLWLIMLAIAALTAWQFVKVIESLGPAPIHEMIVPGMVAILPLAVIIFIRVVTLHTIITDKGIYVRFRPIHGKFRFYPWEDIAAVYVKSYAPILDYGGWGIRGWGSKRALNIAGNIGLKVIFRNGDKLLIGTQQQEALQQALAQIAQAPVTAPEQLH